MTGVAISHWYATILAPNLTSGSTAHTASHSEAAVTSIWLSHRAPRSARPFLVRHVDRPVSNNDRIRPAPAAYWVARLINSVAASAQRRPVSPSNGSTVPKRGELALSTATKQPKSEVGPEDVPGQSLWCGRTQRFDGPERERSIQKHSRHWPAGSIVQKNASSSLNLTLEKNCAIMGRSWQSCALSHTNGGL